MNEAVSYPSDVFERFEPQIEFEVDGEVRPNPLTDPRKKIELPDGENRVLSDFAHDLGQALTDSRLFRRGRELLVVDEDGSRLRRLDATELRTFVEEFVICFKRKVKTREKEVIEFRKTMTADEARAVRESPQFLQHIRPVERLNLAPLPAFELDGAIVLLPQGYHAATQTYTINALKFEETSPARAKAMIDDLLAEFTFRDRGRSKAVAVSAMVTMFARGLLPDSALRPCFVYLANNPGAGKTLLADCAVIPVLGKSYRKAFPRREEELEKMLLASVLEAESVLFFDNVRGHIGSASLEAFLTSIHWKGRVLGKSEGFEGKNNAVTIITGNGCTVSPDLRRRALFIELFVEEIQIEAKQFKRPLNEVELLRRRAEILSALWTMVKAWDADGRPEPSQSRNGCDQWSAIIGGIVEHAGFGCPTALPNLADGGDTDATDIEKLADAISNEKGSQPLTFDEVVNIAADRGLFERLLGGAKVAGDLDPSTKSKVGKLLKRFDQMVVGGEGAHFQVEGKGHGRRFRIQQAADLPPPPPPPSSPPPDPAP